MVAQHVSLADEGVLATVAIGSFTTEAGAQLPAVDLAYQRWGEYRGSNVLLIEHALTGDSDVATWWCDLVGPGKALDTDTWCVIATNVLGGCNGSTGPSSDFDGTPYGSRFPAVSIRDQVEAEKRFLDVLGIAEVHAIIGGSMGGARTLEWTLLYPEMMQAACVIAVSARASAWQIGIQSAQISAIERDPLWQGGDYYAGQSPDEGLAAARRIAHLTYRGEMEIDERFGTSAQAGENPLGAYRKKDQRFAVNSYLDYQGAKLTQRFDAGSYVTLTESLNRHDIGRGRGGLNKALASSQVPTMVVGVDTDILYPYHQQEHISRNLGNLLAMAKLSSPVGHDAFLVEGRQMDRILRNFIKQTLPEGAESIDGVEFRIGDEYII
ncbi:homoserine O-acetyltransferase MetX [Corynebacterium ammoniagenes]|uniref:Homoserine O-acetyltransferase n=2 Tax=Corynebacterium ammoniagenes TaxID=1697 RepID=A0AAV5G672_CORAM|nr:homoserine O-acetyltransferase [Corynebacterium ammoniagenes]APT81934.1 homoserine acetyltransferase [Corynebacterium ammoniagenes DSM 20306]AQS73052.1 homoserine O-acetyltransferase [Corynebacterium ammoniagenes]EFG80538.1 homoserine O-acetyltransferase [Corynebacterium ammoniagenes DSM 20306]NMF31709.1 homoserine O-acetyltransferase [Corynebacterium ammoniagenes]GJN41740.1 homoserine O-acetyltransferase [Corynebacterium ammoniagenes]